MASTVTLTLLTAICLLLYKWVIHPIWLSPLSRIPSAHPTASFSPLWMLWNRFQSREVSSVYAAHVSKGPVVRLGPNEVSVNCVDGGIRTVYAGGFEKHDFYPNQFDNYGVPCMFSTRENKAHSQRKRLLSNLYSKSYLHNNPTIDASTQTIVYDRLLPKVESLRASRDGSLDVFDLFNRTTMDIVTSYMFGIAQSTNFIQDEKTAKWWLGLYHGRRPHAFWMAEVPAITTFLSKLGIHVSPKEAEEAVNGIEGYVMALCEAADDYLETAGPDDDAKHPGNVPVVYKHLTETLLSNGNGTRDEVHLQVASELLDNLAAGHETSSITLTYLFWELSRNQKLQDSLRSELQTLDPPILLSSAKVLPTHKGIDALPLLQAIVLETLRLHAAIPGSQPRITPSKDIVLGSGSEIYKDIPANVRISASAYALHRNLNVFPSPSSFEPSRWMKETKTESVQSEATDQSNKHLDSKRGADADEKLKEQHRWLWPFSSGGRMCIGSHLAMLQMKLIIAALISNYRVRIADDTGIEQEDAYTASPTNKQLWLFFEKVATAPSSSTP